MFQPDKYDQLGQRMREFVMCRLHELDNTGTLATVSWRVQQSCPTRLAAGFQAMFDVGRALGQTDDALRRLLRPADEDGEVA